MTPPIKSSWRSEALDDLEHLRDLVDKQEPGAATGLAHELLEAVELLVEQPHLGRPGRVPRTRELALGAVPWIIAYRVQDGVVDVLRVLHGARRWPEHPPGKKK